MLENILLITTFLTVLFKWTELKKLMINVNIKIQPLRKKVIKKDKRRLRSSKLKNNIKVRQFNKINNKNKEFKAVPNSAQVLLISGITELHYSYEHCLLCTKLPNVLK